jgi:DNA-directed RNA polymerase subunit RPC12/RpoP
MSEFITLTCSSCGGALEITSDTEQFVCQYCKRKHIIKRSGGTIFLDGLAQVITGVDRTGSEMAIVRLKEEIPALENRRVNRLKEFQARKTNMLGLETVIKEAEKEKRRAYLELAIYAVLAAMFAVLAVAGRSIVGMVCFLLLAW